MKTHLREICGAPTCAAAEAVTEVFADKTAPSTTRRSTGWPPSIGISGHLVVALPRIPQPALLFNKI
jgi:hypothetical protein